MEKLGTNVFVHLVTPICMPLALGSWGYSPTSGQKEFLAHSIKRIEIAPNDHSYREGKGVSQARKFCEDRLTNDARWLVGWQAVHRLI
ncbi:Hypothetical predicted protein [Olea europaea subsp. europaea]|uniref:Uncharacterized protein n=1 Tax=Olea europaea subsp. europaea TaxID=158383 RepID=A0A8S0TUU5_OLEEU|nr:Hypothetical predicted protein [Olea europaea subsp. europaea]